MWWSVESRPLGHVALFLIPSITFTMAAYGETYLVEIGIGTSVRPSIGTIGTGGAGLAGSSPLPCAGNGYRWPSAFLHVVFPALLVGVLVLLLVLLLSSMLLFVIVAQFGKGKLDETTANDPAVSDRVSLTLANVDAGTNGASGRVGGDGRRSRGREVAGAR